MNKSKISAVLLALLILLEPCAAVLAKSAIVIPDPVPNPIIDSATVEKQGIDFSLTPTLASPDSAEKSAVTTSGEALPQERLNELLKRLPPLAPPKGDALILPEQSLIRPPLSGIQTAEIFPPNVEPLVNRPAVEKTLPFIAPLKIERVSPTGAIGDAAEISVTFSQPMTPLAAAGTVQADKYLHLEPQPAGQWEWAGTQTLLFHPKNDDKRLPKATDYKLTVPQTTVSINGQSLEVAYTASIQTPPVAVEAFYPISGIPQTDKPLIFMTFNQRINRTAILPYLQLTAGGKKFALEMVPDETFFGFGGKVKLPINVSKKDNFIALRPKKALPHDATYQLSLMPGCPSQEGAKLTEKRQDYPLTVHGPLKFVRGPADKTVAGYTAAHFTFNNPLDTRGDLGKLISISPEPQQRNLRKVGSDLFVEGDFKPFQKYTVSISGDLRDEFDQKLGKDMSYSWTMGAKERQLRQGQQFLTIAPGQKPELSFYAQAVDNVHVKIYRVNPSHLKAFSENRWHDYDYQSDRDLGDIAIGDLTHEEDFRIKELGADEGAYVSVDLAPYLHNNHGQFVVVGTCPATERHRVLRFASWVQVTELGLNLFKGKKLNALVTRLADGSPVAGARVQCLPNNCQGVTGADGVAAVDYASAQAKPDTVLSASLGDDVVSLSSVFASWREAADRETIIWHCLADRFLYRPGQTVHVKGWQRGFGSSDNGAVRLFDSGLTKLHYEVVGIDGLKVAQGDAAVDKSSGFNFDVALPDKINLGILVVHIIPDKTELTKFSAIDKPEVAFGRNPPIFRLETSIVIDVEEYRRPEFAMKVNTTSASIALGEATKLSAHAAYFGGGALPDTKVKWAVQATPYAFHPPKWIDFRFGKEFYNFPQQTLKKSLETTSDKDGVSAVELKAISVSEPMSVSMRCEATFSDINRQTWSDNTTVIVHSARAFVGTKLVSSPKGEKIRGKLIVTDDGGKAISGRPVKAALYRRDDDGKKVQVAARELISEGTPVEFEFALDGGGNNFTFEATSVDNDGRPALNQYQYFVAHMDFMDARQSANLPRDLTLSTDSEKYHAGQNAQITITSPVYPAEGLLLVARRLLRSTIPLKFTSETTTISLPITEEDYPDLTIQAVLNGKDGLHATGSTKIAVPPVTKALTLTVMPDKDQIAPGSTTYLNVSLKDNSGAAVSGGHVAIAVVDEAVFALHNFRWSDPIKAFYPESNFTPSCGLSRNNIYFSADVEERRRSDRSGRLPVLPSVRSGFNSLSGHGDVAMLDAAPSGALVQTAGNAFNSLGSMQIAGRNSSLAAPTMARLKGDNLYENKAVSFSQSSATPLMARQNFNELALFAPDVVTDAAGHARVVLKLPDSSTKYRITAIAVKDLDKFGATEASLSTKMALSIKPSLPRFLNFGDKCEMPFIVQNQTDRALPVDVAIRIQSGKSITSEGKRVEVPANARVEVRFPCNALSQGEMTVQTAAISGEFDDATSLTIPIMVPASFESFAAYGQIDKGAILQKLDFPKDVYDQLGGLQVTTSSTALQALTDAYIYLRDYPFDCSEQLSARVLTMLALHDPLVAFGIIKADGEKEYKLTIEKSLKKLLGRQLPLGGFGLWTSHDEDISPYTSMQVIKALNSAAAKDFAVDENVLAQGKQYLKDIRSHISADYNEVCKQAIRAQALKLRHEMGDDDVAAAKQLVADATTLLAPETAAKSSSSIEMACWLLPVLSRAPDAVTEVSMLRKVLNNAIVETGSTASANVRGWEPWFYLLYSSPRRVDAEILDALMADQPDSQLIPKLVKGLLAHRKKGAWNGSQENYKILEALDNYFHRYERDVPNFTAREWIGANFIGQQSFVGRTAESKVVTVPTRYILEHAASDVLIAKDGPGRLYYRLGVDYVPHNLVLKPLSLGFEVSKKYEGVEKKDDVSLGRDGVWHVRAGALVKCKVHFSNVGARYHVALMVPMPAGCEPVNGMLAGNQTILPDAEPTPPHMLRSRRGIMPAFAPRPSHFIWWWRDWYEHQNLRDHQAEAFTSLLNAGEHDYSYTMRATTPGRFVVPPTKIEEMYDTETFGRTGTETMVID